MSVGVLIVAKKPRPGLSKTRLSPPCSPAEAAKLASASLKDTLAVVERSSATSKVMVVDDVDDDWLAPEFEILRQRGGGLEERLANAFEDFGNPSLLIGMDTPQITVDLLNAACALLEEPSNDAVLGPTNDGGYWAIGLKEPNRAAFANVPMSTSATFATQQDRLQALGLHCVPLPRLRDVDYFDDACAVAGQIPTSEFAYALGRVIARIGQRLA